MQNNSTRGCSPTAVQMWLADLQWKHIQTDPLPPFVLQWADPGLTRRAPDPQGSLQVVGAKSWPTLAGDSSHCVNNTHCVGTVFPIHHVDYARVSSVSRCKRHALRVLTRVEPCVRVCACVRGLNVLYMYCKCVYELIKSVFLIFYLNISYCWPLLHKNSHNNSETVYYCTAQIIRLSLHFLIIKHSINDWNQQPQGAAKQAYVLRLRQTALFQTQSTTISEQSSIRRTIQRDIICPRSPDACPTGREAGIMSLSL